MSRKSSKRAEIYEFIRRRTQESGYPPSVREIAAAVHLSSPATVYVHLTNLRNEGKIEMTEGKKRAIKLVEPQEQETGIPIVGSIAAGDPVFMDEHIEGYIAQTAVEKTQGMFALKVRGESMTGAGILEGDLVVIDPGAQVGNGEIAAVCSGDEATVKRVYYERGALRLVPENPAYHEVVSRDASVVGKVTAVIRYY